MPPYFAATLASSINSSVLANMFGAYIRPEDKPMAPSRIAVGQKVEIGVTVEVDETGRHNQPRSVDHPLRRGVDQPADTRNPSVLDCHRTLEPGTPAAVDDVSVNDQQVVLAALSPLLRHVANA